ncbi:MAG: hypothetical protein NTV31_08560 [Bacteroidia bacterium]|nr:hypothetical protein [Bacteroidia bacterium]
MASIIPGYEYDIFISYRQKDNKHDGWVTEFVENLKGELESTFKEDVSVYFDINPHDGLLETHDVNASLKEKLKCLVFIPIISRTYCDPKSFAWEHEFKAFIEQASRDQYGLKVKLPNGNVANRVLPIRIHDLDNDDIKLCESILGGVLRGVEFIYKEPGVDKPLAPEDNEKKNLNNTKYRIQIIKVALAIKEIILGLKTEPVVSVKENAQLREPLKEIKKEESSEEKKVPAKLNKRKFLSGVAILAILIILAVLAYPKIFNIGKSKVARDPNGKISIVINTFENLTGDTTLNTWRDGISELLIGNLGASKELSVQNSQTMHEVYESMGQTKYASVVPSLSREAAIKLKAGAYITGSFLKTGNKIRIQLKLVDTKRDELLWTGKVDGDLNSDYIDLTDSLSTQVRNYLEIKALEQNTSQDFKDTFTNSADAYRKYIEGMNSFRNSNYMSAIQSFNEAYKTDSTFTLAAFYIAYAYNNYNNINSNILNLHYSKEWTQKAFEGRKRLPENYQIWVEAWKAYYNTNNANEMFNLYSLLENSDIKSRYYWYDIGSTYTSYKKYDKAVKAFEKIETISSDWGGDWKYWEYYYWYGTACHYTGSHKKESKIYETGLNLFPNNIWLIFSQARCAISQGDTVKASEHEKKLVAICKEMGWSARAIENGLGYLYREAKSLDKAEEHYRLALQLGPTRTAAMDNLAYLLIYFDKNIEEGMKLINKALKLSPGNPDLLHTLGLGYYKQRKYEEALTNLEVAKDSSFTINPDLDQQIQDVKDALANQKK